MRVREKRREKKFFFACGKAFNPLKNIEITRNKAKNKAISDALKT